MRRKVKVEISIDLQLVAQAIKWCFDWDKIKLIKVKIQVKMKVTMKEKVKKKENLKKG